jgi:hypothetical protein
MIRWRGAGEGMGTIDLGALKGDQVIIHYGGALTSIDAYTFANSLIELADTVCAINRAIDPNQNIEVRLEALNTGSFRALLKRIPKGIGDFFSIGSKEVFWGIVVALLFQRYFEKDPKITINVGATEVVIEKEGDRVIIPRIVYEKAEQLKENIEIRKHISKTFEIIEQDHAVENFGITAHPKDKEPLVQFMRSDFSKFSFSELALSEPPVLVESKPGQRDHHERAMLVILKAWFKRGATKWSFEWNGHPISAKIEDQDFFTKLENREILLGAGDALDAELFCIQDFDKTLGIYINDPATFVVEKVYGAIPRVVQARLI